MEYIAAESCTLGWWRYFGIIGTRFLEPLSTPRVVSSRKEVDKSGPKTARWRKRVGRLFTINRRFTFLTGHEKSLGTRVEVLGR